MDDENKLFKTYASFMGGWMAGAVVSHIVVKILTVIGVLWVANQVWCKQVGVIMEKNNIYGAVKDAAKSGTTAFFVIYGTAWLVKAVVCAPFKLLAMVFNSKKPAKGIVPADRDVQITEFERLISMLPAGDQLKYKRVMEENPELMTKFLNEMKQIGYTK